MLNSTSVNSVPTHSMFQGVNSRIVTTTQVKPNAFRVNYFADGTGRDTFVKNDNGGFYKAYEPVRAVPVTSFTSKRQYAPPAPVMKSRGVYYHSDGSGRDSYVCVNAGGLTSVGRQTEYRDAFKKSLRTIQRPQTSYVKLGQSQAGIKRSPTVTLLPPRINERTDLMVQTQLTFSRKFVETQN